MLRDIKDIFRKLRDQDPEMVFDAYEMREGLYMRFDPTKSISENLENIDGNYMNYVKPLEGEQIENKELFDWFKERDYLSNYLDDGTPNAMNKSIDSKGKAVYSTNHYTMFLRNNFVCSVTSLSDGSVVGGESVENVGVYTDLSVSDVGYVYTLESYIDTVFNSVKNNRTKLEKMVTNLVKSKTNKKEIIDDIIKENFQDVYTYATSEARENAINTMRDIWEEGVIDFIEAIKNDNRFNNLDDKSYIRVFFDVDLRLYKDESDLYNTSRIFIKNDYNILNSENVIYGASYNDNTFNKKKPFTSKGELTIGVNHRMTVEEAVEIRDMFYWIGSATKRNRLLSEDRLFDFRGKLRDHKKLYVRGGRMTILDFDNLTEEVESDINAEVKNYVLHDDVESYYITELYGVQKLLSKNFFDNRINNDLYKLDDSVLGDFNKTMSSYINRSSNALIEWFYKGNSSSIRHMIDKMTDDILRSIITNSLSNGNANKKTVMFTLNARLFLLEYLNVKEKCNLGNEIIGIREWFENSMNEDEFSIENTDQLYYSIGQLIQYLNSQSKSKDKNISYVEGALRKGNLAQLKRELDRLLMMYGYAIKDYNFKFKKVLSAVMLAEDSEKVLNKKRDMLLSGLVTKCAFYSKKENVEVIENVDSGEEI